jgi:hypothetical protein
LHADPRSQDCPRVRRFAIAVLKNAIKNRSTPRPQLKVQCLAYAFNVPHVVPYFLFLVPYFLFLISYFLFLYSILVIYLIFNAFNLCKSVGCE